MSDAELIGASYDDPEQFAGIFERHYDAIHRYVSRRLGSRLADDIAAQVFAVAFERRRTFELARPDARPWLYGIASNLVGSNRRAERRMLAAVSRLGARAEPPADVPEDGITDDRETARLAGALNKLDQQQRHVLLLHCWAGLSHAEIAAALDVPAGTVASRLSRARQRVRAAVNTIERPLAAPMPKEEP